ncbi:MAG: polyphosphate kinase 2 family protein [Gemmatimonadales bacterium]|nr:polyphosphate kinase 2 family protein [Gemmatimonadales bacterium]
MTQPRLAPHPLGRKIRLTDAMAAAPAGLPPKPRIAEEIDALGERLEALQAALGADGRRALLIVLQGRDASGKDGTVKRVFGYLNPALTAVTGFKRPTPLELRHDYLWRVHQVVPARGMIGIFNRSHYEDLLAARVHRLVPEAVWRKRYDQINAFERLLADEGIVIRKFFLHISKDEQRKRLAERLDDPTKNWKFELGDLAERARWDDYSRAYEAVLARTSTPHAPWYLVPADKNSARDLLVAQVVVAALEEIGPTYPKPDPKVLALRGKIK